MTPNRIGRYEIQRRLGSGGMGSLYLARDPGLDRLVAIKLLKEDYQDDPELRERFTREARSVARLRHPNIVIVHDVGEDEGRPFMAMEYIAGETLTQILRRQPPLPLVKRLGLVEDLCAGLAHAHAAGVIHRDIKPANIMLDGDGVLKILDFGIARLGNSGMTAEGMMMGTVNYMSPEQVVGRGVDHRSDIFATGAVLYEAIALEQAFPGRIDTGVLHRILTEGPVPLSERVPDVDPELDGIVRRALEREPGQRYQDANVVRRDLTRVRRRLEERSKVASTRETEAAERVEPSSPATGERPGDRSKPLSSERFKVLRQQQVEEHLRFGEEAFARGDHDAALQHAERAAAVDSESHTAFELIERVRFAIEAKAIRQLLAEANRLLADGHLDDAAALADEASVTVPDLAGAADLRSEVRQTSEKIAAARDREQRISASLKRARAQIEQGTYETALRAIYEVLALDPEREEARELEQLAKSRLKTQREHEQARRSAYERLKNARALASEGKYEEALEAISDVTPPSDTVKVAAADALAAVRALQRQAAQAAIVTGARAAFERGQLQQALAALDGIPADEWTNDARSLRKTIEDALRQQRELEQKRLALEDALIAIRNLIENGDLTRALERLEDAARIGLADDRIPTMRRYVAELAVAAQEKRRQEARDRQAAKRVEAARRLLANGDGYAAILLLERDGSGHELVEKALREIHAVVAEQEERVRQEAERKRREEEEARRRAELEAARRLEGERKAAEKQRQEEARRREEERRLKEQEARQLAEMEAARLREEQQGEAERLRQEEEQRREAARHREEEARQREEALTKILTRVRTTDTHEIALDLLNEALTLAPGDPRVQTIINERSAALERRRAEEQRRQEEARRREDEARKREEALAGLLTQAREIDAHEAALTILRQAQTFAPNDPRVQAQIHERNAALDAERRAAAAQAAEEAAQREQERVAKQERDAQAAAVVDQARRIFGSGQHEEALALLRRSPTHALTQTAIADLEARRVEIEREQERKNRVLRRQERRGALIARLRGALGGSRARLAGGVILVTALAATIWQFRPLPSSGVDLSPSTSTSTSVRPPVTVPPPATGTTGAVPPVIAPPARGTTSATQPTPVATPIAPPGSKPPITKPPTRGSTGVVPPVTTPPAAGSSTAAPLAVPSTAGAPSTTPLSPVPPTSAAQSPTPPVTGPSNQSPVGNTPATNLPPVVSSRDADEAAIRQLLEQYVTAYNRMNEQRLREIDRTFRGIPSRPLLKSVDLKLSNLSITTAPDGQSAVLTATQSFSYEWNRARLAPTSTGSLRWNLRKVGGLWTVVP